MERFCFIIQYSSQSLKLWTSIKLKFIHIAQHKTFYSTSCLRKTALNSLKSCGKNKKLSSYSKFSTGCAPNTYFTPSFSLYPFHPDSIFNFTFQLLKNLFPLYFNWNFIWQKNDKKASKIQILIHLYINIPLNMPHSITIMKRN